MTQPDIHAGLAFDDSMAYRQICQERYWDLMDQVEAARVALAAIANHIQSMGKQPTMEPDDKPNRKPWGEDDE